MAAGLLDCYGALARWPTKLLCAVAVSALINMCWYGSLAGPTLYPTDAHASLILPCLCGYADSLPSVLHPAGVLLAPRDTGYLIEASYDVGEVCFSLVQLDTRSERHLR